MNPSTSTLEAPSASTTQPESVVLRAERLTRRFGDHTAVSELDLEIRRGEIY